MTTIVAMSDTHMRHKSLTVPNGDVLIHCGDACNVGDWSEWYAWLVWFASLPHEHKLYVPGNHDVVTMRRRDQCLAYARERGVTMLIDEEVTVAGLRVYGMPWMPEWGTWPYMLPRDGEKLRQHVDAIPPGLDVLVTHGPAYGVLDTVKRDAERDGCKLLRERLLRLGDAAPDVHVFGHLHHDGGLWGRWVCDAYNVATTVRAINMGDEDE